MGSQPDQYILAKILFDQRNPGTEIQIKLIQVFQNQTNFICLVSHLTIFLLK